MTDAEREAAGIAPARTDLIERYTKPANGTAPPSRSKRFEPSPRDPNEPSDEELLQQLRKPAPAATVAANARPPTDWEDSPEGIDQAGHVLGMKRLPFEDDPEFAHRIRARLELG